MGFQILFLNLKRNYLTYIYVIKLKIMKVNELKKNHYAFGNKGDVWGNTAHIAQSNTGDYRTLCGRPMLSNNWVRIEQVEHIGCPKCLEKYNSEEYSNVEDVINELYWNIKQ